MPGVVVFAPLGPNPASMVELLWWLRRERGLSTDAVHVVVDAEAQRWLRSEVLAPNTALDALRDALGGHVPRHVVEHVVVDALGAPLRDDVSPDDAERYRDAVWNAAIAATREAGERSVYFGLCGRRRRTMTAMTSTAFQWLARRGDVCVDVRVTDRRAEGGSGFFFPEQPWQLLVGRRDEPFLAREVGIRVIEVALPRLRGLVAERHLASYASALAAGQAAVDEGLPPALCVDLSLGRATVGGQKLPLSSSELVWLATLAVARLEAVEWVAVRSSTVFDRVLATAMAAFGDEIRHVGLDTHARTPLDDLTEPLAKLRSDVTRKLRRWTAEHGHATWLVPESKRRRAGPEPGAWMRLPLPATRIEVLGLA